MFGIGTYTYDFSVENYVGNNTSIPLNFQGRIGNIFTEDFIQHMFDDLEIGDAQLEAPGLTESECKVIDIDVSAIINRFNNNGIAHKRDHSKDCFRLAVLYSVRGTKLQKMQQRMPEEGKSNVQDLIATYQLKETPTSPSDLTLSRVGVVFSPFVAKFMSSGSGREMIPADRFKISRALAFAGSATLIPTTPVWDETFKAIFLWNIVFSSSTINLLP